MMAITFKKTALLESKYLLTNLEEGCNERVVSLHSLFFVTVSKIVNGIKLLGIRPGRNGLYQSHIS